MDRLFYAVGAIVCFVLVAFIVIVTVVFIMEIFNYFFQERKDLKLYKERAQCAEKRASELLNENYRLKYELEHLQAYRGKT